ncbi:unnamed protein product [Notodromas monacha]|uniref:Uncharacterized protein n=1 Tax=Notodromas monacha TaxID=399045 RepID=A0A7R9BFK7_9CRUS|nr:unnamed protein product [Notodromas monacha]CAG0912927.1 unnamed protein product [Notodromas monacha]
MGLTRLWFKIAIREGIRGSELQIFECPVAIGAKGITDIHYSIYCHTSSGGLRSKYAWNMSEDDKL